MSDNEENPENPHRTRFRVKNNPTVAEVKQRAFEECRRKWPEEDEEAREALEAEGKTIEDSLLSTVEPRNDQEEDVLRLFVKILETHDYEHNFPINPQHPLLHFLRLEFNGHCQRQWNPNQASGLIKDIPLKEARIQLRGRKSTLCARFEVLSESVKRISMGLSDWKTVLTHFKIAAGDIWMDMMDTCLVCLFLYGKDLKDELEKRKNFISAKVLPVFDIVDVALRDKQILKPMFFSDYDTHYSNPEEEPLMLDTMTEEEIALKREEMREIKFGASVIEEQEQELDPEPEKPKSTTVHQPLFTTSNASTSKPGLGNLR